MGGYQESIGINVRDGGTFEKGLFFHLVDHFWMTTEKYPPAFKVRNMGKHNVIDSPSRKTIRNIIARKARGVFEIRVLLGKLTHFVNPVQVF